MRDLAIVREKRNRESAFRIYMSLVLFILMALPGAVGPLFLPLSAAAADAHLSVRDTSEQRLIGQWIRPDGGYILEIKEIGKDGSLKAAYYNPRSINVSRAELSRKDGGLNVLIELRDVNYPGSTYRLRYDPKSDRLIGTYFQAVEQVTYDIQFVRVSR
jgi:uncharacterized protein (DUF2147 family)